MSPFGSSVFTLNGNLTTGCGIGIGWNSLQLWKSGMTVNQKMLHSGQRGILVELYLMYTFSIRAVSGSAVLVIITSVVSQWGSQCAETKVQIMVQHHMDWSQTKGGYNVLRNGSNSQTHPEDYADRNQERDLFVHMSCRIASAGSPTEMVDCLPRETYVCLAGLFHCWQC